MKYIYDINLNFNDTFFEFYDWNKKDKIVNIKKIPIFKISHGDLKNIRENKVEFDINFLKTIDSKCEYYQNRNIKKYRYAFLLTDSESVIGINITNKINYSSLHISDELDILEDVKLDYFNIEYKIIEKNNINIFKTRNQIEEENKIISYLNKSIERENIDELKYLYYECFEEKEDDLKKIVARFKNFRRDKEIYKKLSNFLRQIN